MADAFRIRNVGSSEKPLPQISATIFLKDPYVAERDKRIGMTDIKLEGEACLGAGPTSSRVAVVDYNAALDKIFEPARLLADGKGFSVGSPKKAVGRMQFHQVNVWAVITHTLNFMESEKFLGRRIPWAFGRGRLIVLPHAGYWENAYYDRETGALHFFYYEGEDGHPIYTSLSHDIITHELGHAILDGLKPYYNEVSSPDTAGFHEYFGDALALTAALHQHKILIKIVKREDSDLSAPGILSNIAAEFGGGRPADPDSPLAENYLRTARNNKKMKHLEGTFEEHDYSEVLTGAYYDLFLAVHKIARRQVRRELGRKANAAAIRVSAAVRAAQVTGRMMLRGLDYCPPVDVNYLDYARAVIKADTVAYPRDPVGYCEAAKKVFLKRGIGKDGDDLEDSEKLRNSQFRELDVERISASKTNAYDFVDSNRKVLKVPPTANIEIVHVYRTKKLSADGYRPPQEVVVEFVWAEDIQLRGARFGELRGTKFPLWCGGTIVMNRDGNVLHYVLKQKTTQRRQRLLDYIEYLIVEDYIGLDDDEEGLEARAHGANVITGKVVDGRLRLHRTAAFRHQKPGVVATSTGAIDNEAFWEFATQRAVASPPNLTSHDWNALRELIQDGGTEASATDDTEDGT